MWLALAAAVLAGPVALTGWRFGLEKPISTVLVALGVVGLIAMAVTTCALGRVRSLTSAFGIDRLVGAHRWLGIAAIVAVLAHLVVAVVRSPSMINPFSVSLGIQWGYLSTVALIAVGLAAAWGRRTGRQYELWARVHILMAGAALVLAALHVVWLGDMLEDPVLRPMLTVLALALLAALLVRWVWRPLFSRHGAYVVYGVRRESASVATLVLAPVHMHRGLRFHAGQFVWLRRRRSVLGSQEHPFTIASSAQITGRLELTIRGQGDFSEELAALPVGTRVWLDGPHGSFTAESDDGADGLALIAGGVGITPMMSMLRTLADRGDRRVHHLVLAQRPDEPLFADELASLAARLDLRVIRLDGRRVDAALLAAALPDPRTSRLDHFVCGPPSLLTGSLDALERLGVPPERVHTEQFGWSGPVPTVAPPAVPSSGGPSAPGRTWTPDTGAVPRRAASRMHARSR